MRRLGAVASAVARKGAKRRAECDGAASSTSVPYFALSVRGHLADSARAPLADRDAHEESPGAHEVRLAADRAVPYFELSLPGSVRVFWTCTRPYSEFVR
jgi:hypothetical protein